MRLISLGALLAMAFTASCTAGEKPNDPWMAGFWHITADEDNGPLGGVIEFRPDGTYAGYDSACNSYGTIEFHVHRGDIYVTNTIPGKGPVSVIFHPSDDLSRLTFTSPRTKNNAVYERVPGNKCVGQG